MAGEKRDFDKVAATWDEEPRRVKLAADIAAAISREAKLSPDMDVLDYGCGTGLVAMHISPHVRSVTGADSSKGMLEVLDRKANGYGMTNIHSILINAGFASIRNVTASVIAKEADNGAKRGYPLFLVTADKFTS